MKSNTQILQEILALAETDLKADGEMGYTMPDGKHHIYIYQDQIHHWNRDPEDVYVVEPNRVEDGAHEPMGDTYVTKMRDLSEVLIGCQWCMEEFEADRLQQAQKAPQLLEDLSIRMAHQAGWMESQGDISIPTWDALQTAIRDAMEEYYKNPDGISPLHLEDIYERILSQRFSQQSELSSELSKVKDVYISSPQGYPIVFAEDGSLLCHFAGEAQPRPIRSRIQDIKEGDCFMTSGKMIHVAAEDAHQNLDEPEKPWIVYDGKDDAWFEEDIVNVARLIAAAEHGKAAQPAADGIPVNLVTIVRECLSVDQVYTDDFWVDARQVPTIDLFKAAAVDYLKTMEGKYSIWATGEDFNWGDAMMDIPQDIWNQHGIYPVDRSLAPKEMGLAPTPNYNAVTFRVDQDELLIPDTYFTFKEQYQWYQGWTESGVRFTLGAPVSEDMGPFFDGLQNIKWMEEMIGLPAHGYMVQLQNGDSCVICVEAEAQREAAFEIVSGIRSWSPCSFGLDKPAAKAPLNAQIRNADAQKPAPDTDPPQTPGKRPVR